MPSLSDPVVFAACIAILGAAAGLIAGLFGIGGGIIIVPMLAVLFKMRGILPDPAIHAAVGVSMMTVVPTSIASFRAHARRGAIESDIVRAWAPAIIIGSLLGSMAAHTMSGASLTLIFGVFVAAMAAFLGFVPPDLHALTSPPGGAARRVVAFVIGFFSALIGIGGGSLTVPTLVLCRSPIHRAIGTASVIGFLISLPAALVFLAMQIMRMAAPDDALGTDSIFILELITFTVLALMTMVTAPVGARLAHKLPAVKLRRFFAALLAIIAVKMLASGLG